MLQPVGSHSVPVRNARQEAYQMRTNTASPDLSANQKAAACVKAGLMRSNSAVSGPKPVIGQKRTRDDDGELCRVVVLL